VTAIPASKGLPTIFDHSSGEKVDLSAIGKLQKWKHARDDNAVLVTAVVDNCRKQIISFHINRPKLRKAFIGHSGELAEQAVIAPLQKEIGHA
jgi:hypothetical protein